MKKANKPALADRIAEEAYIDTTPEKVQYVLDRVSWPQTNTYDNICKMYADFVHADYAKAIIVFAGYQDGPSLKDIIHKDTQRAKRKLIFTSMDLWSATPRKMIFFKREEQTEIHPPFRGQT